MNLIENLFEVGERLGFAVSKHPTGTVLVKNFREYVLFFPQENGSVSYEVREPLYAPSRTGNTWSELELRTILKELK